MDLDEFGSPVGTVYSEDGCPPELMCIPKETFDEMMIGADMEYNPATQTIEPAGDAEAIIDFTQTLLTLDFWTILSFSIPLTIFAIYGLTIYAGVKWIQKKLS
jgi:hypothetical protein